MASSTGDNSSSSSSSGGGGGGGGNKDPWAWLGLLKWSLAYSDGTRDNSSSSVGKMSDEDRAFLEAVMKEGIIDENERMKVILQQVTDIMSTWNEKQQQQQQQHEQEATTASLPAFDFDAEQVKQVQDLLQELRDIVEQIDYARAFCALGGLEFLLGTLLSIQQQCDDDNSSSSCTTSSLPSIPYSIVELCSGILATLSTNNPPVQAQLLELGSIRILTNAYFACDNSTMATTTDADTARRSTISRLQSRILQAMSANVRSHAVAEQVFCATAQAVPLLQHCLGVCSGEAETTQAQPPLELQQRGLFFLRALVTSDSSTPERIQRFGPCIATVMDRFVLATSDSVTADGQQDDDDFVQLLEMTLAMIQQLLEAANSSDSSPSTASSPPAASTCPPILWKRRDALVARGVQRVPTLRAAFSSYANDDDEYTRAQHQSELDHWEAILVLLARATPPPPEQTTPAADHTTTTTNPLMIAAVAPETTPSQ